RFLAGTGYCPQRKRKGERGGCTDGARHAGMATVVEEEDRHRRRNIGNQGGQRGQEEEEREQVDETAGVVQRDESRREYSGDQHPERGRPAARAAREDARE